MAYSSHPTAQQNEAALDYFIQMPVSREMIQYLAAKASEVIRCEHTVVMRQGLPTPPASPPTVAADPTLPSLEAFITSIVERSHVQVPTLMTSLVYLARLKARLPAMAKGMKCTVHRIFLASLILAAKNLNDSSPKNKHWARYSAVRGYENFGFSITEVNLMEKQLLFLLDWDLNIRPDDLYTHLEPFLAPIRLRIAQRAEELAIAQREREWRHRQAALIAQQLSYAQHQQHQQQPGYTLTAPAVRPPTRTPSLSPPTRSSSSASDHSSLSSATSMSSSPASLSIDADADAYAYDAYCPSIVEQHELAPHYAAQQQEQVAQLLREKSVHHLPGVAGAGASKKQRLAGPGFLSRMLGQTARTQVY
ncbi:MAG: cyclin [Terriglobus roseus]|nr:cyclin [Terriglobus roseus]